ncbi:hypothetical protein POVCU2_0005890 [Plasmodium ovale curtisi]|uniref:Uncharacterized protein n=1 Tax=Plasmodium ovale curtisi TaxID=864141 RepID=A0A1A8VMM5_PLAOA|nr:hypothetical protein POVCU2_0005890 [Plasmodium ovale curtisi]
MRTRKNQKQRDSTMEEVPGSAWKRLEAPGNMYGNQPGWVIRVCGSTMKSEYDNIPYSAHIATIVSYTNERISSTIKKIGS